MDFLQFWQNILSSGTGQVIGNTAVALACGFLISLLYRWTYRGPGYSITFVNSIPALAMITAVVIMVIGNNLARAFGLVGALSIIRFRTAIKDTQDIVFIFFSLAVGMAAGVGLYSVVIIATVFVGACIFVLSKINYASPRRREFLLQFCFASSGEREAPYLPILQKHCRRHELINVKSFGDGDLLELSYYVNLRARDRCAEFVRELGQIQEVTQVNLFFDEEEF